MDENQNMEQREEPLASEIYKDLKTELKFKNRLIYVLIAVIAVMALYHDWKWSQFDTISVDAGGGYSNYITGENTGGVYNGPSQSEEAAERQR